MLGPIEPFRHDIKVVISGGSASRGKVAMALVAA